MKKSPQDFPNNPQKELRKIRVNLFKIKNSKNFKFKYFRSESKSTQENYSLEKAFEPFPLNKISRNLVHLIDLTIELPNAFESISQEEYMDINEIDHNKEEALKFSPIYEPNNHYSCEKEYSTNLFNN
jgi:hypothetical protein